MKKTIKTSDVLSVFNIINNAKYKKLDDSDKIRVWKIARKLKPVATKFDEDSKDAAEKFKEGIKDFEERLGNAQKYEQAKQQNNPTGEIMSDSEYESFIMEFREYNDLVAKAVKEYGDKEVEIEFETISEDALEKLMSSNDWTIAQVIVVGEFVCE